MEANAKWPAFSRRHLKSLFIEKGTLRFLDYTEMFSNWSNWRVVRFGLGNGCVPKRRRSIYWIYDEQVHWCIAAYIHSVMEDIIFKVLPNHCSQNTDRNISYRLLHSCGGYNHIADPTYTYSGLMNINARSFAAIKNILFINTRLLSHLEALSLAFLLVGLFSDRC